MYFVGTRDVPIVSVSVMSACFMGVGIGIGSYHKSGISIGIGLFHEYLVSVSVRQNMTPNNRYSDTFKNYILKQFYKYVYIPSYTLFIFSDTYIFFALLI